MDERKDRIVPVLIDDCAPADLHLKLRQVQFVDYREDRDLAQERLLSVWNVDLKPRPQSDQTTDADLCDDDAVAAYVRSPHELRLQGQPDTVRKAYPISGTHWLGRAPDCDIRVNDAAVARRHAKIVLDDQDCVYLTDLDTANGTFVNGNRVHEIQLQDNDEICVGFHSFRYRTFTPDQIQRSD
jgi:hypothetical protein